MKNSTYYIIVVLFAVLAGCSKDFLETKPHNSISESDAFNSPDKVDVALNGLYDLITNTNFNTHISLTSDIKGGDILVVSTGNYGRFVTEYQYIQAPTVGYGEDFWNNGYKIIANANNAITQLPAAPIEDSKRSDYLAEARAIRAYAYLHLVRLFSQPYAVDRTSPGIPVLDRVFKYDEEAPSRGTVEQVYTFILDDLLYAHDNISPSRANNAGRLTINAVDALLARVYLDMENWEKASEFAKLARTGYPLVAPEKLLDGFVDPTDEWVWTLVYRSDDNTGYLQIASFFCPYDIGYSTFRATESFLNLFAEDDIRRKQFYVNENKVATGAGDFLQRDGIIFSRDGYLINKFYFRSDWALDVPLIRSAEMYLIEAEAEAELDNDDLAQTALFEVQKRAITGAVKSTNTGDALKLEIRDERRKELFGEGFRLYDITRRKETLVRDEAEHWAPIVLAPGDHRNILPIPQKERDVSGIPQNAGYPN